jgi:hypothetical protein
MHDPESEDSIMAETTKLPEGFDWRTVTPEDSPKTPMDVMADPTHTRLATAELVAGDLAYDFTSPVYDFSDGTEKSTGTTFNLAEVAREKPVALIFGSYT